MRPTFRLILYTKATDGRRKVPPISFGASGFCTSTNVEVSNEVSAALARSSPFLIRRLSMFSYFFFLLGLPELAEVVLRSRYRFARRLEIKKTKVFFKAHFWPRPWDSRYIVTKHHNRK